MTDTVASVVLAFDILFIIIAVKVLIRLIVVLRQMPPAPRHDTRLRPAVSGARERSSSDAPGAEFDERHGRDGPVPHLPR